MIKHSIVIAAAAALVGACAGPSAQTSQGPVEARSCLVNALVVVSNNVIQPIPDIIVTKSSCRIAFRLNADTKYEFPQNAILIQDNDDEFEDCKSGKNGTYGSDNATFICKDKNTKHAGIQYKYTVTVTTNDGSAPPAPLDPIIVNN